MFCGLFNSAAGPGAAAVLLLLLLLLVLLLLLLLLSLGIKLHPTQSGSFILADG